MLEAGAVAFSVTSSQSSCATAYLERRKIPAELIERYGVGYAPDGWRNLVGALHPRSRSPTSRPRAWWRGPKAAATLTTASATG